MGIPAPVPYRGSYGRPRPASGRTRPVPPGAVVSAGLGPGPLPGRGNPGAARRGVRRDGLVLRGQLAAAVVPGGVAGEMGEAVAAAAIHPGGRLPRGAGPHPDAPAP